MHIFLVNHDFVDNVIVYLSDEFVI